MNKCDCCWKFGELEEITITIKKHKECDVNTLFQNSLSHQVPPQTVSSPIINARPMTNLGGPFPSIPKIIDHDMPPIDFEAQAMAEKLKVEGKL